MRTDPDARTMPKPSRDGEHIRIYYMDDYADNPEYLRGHIDGERAAEIMNRMTGGDYDPSSASHVWARWHFSSCQDWDRELCELPTQERGAFKVTRLTKTINEGGGNP